MWQSTEGPEFQLLLQLWPCVVEPKTQFVTRVPKASFANTGCDLIGILFSMVEFDTTTLSTYFIFLHFLQLEVGL